MRQKRKLSTITANAEKHHYRNIAPLNRRIMAQMRGTIQRTKTRGKKKQSQFVYVQNVMRPGRRNVIIDADI